LGAKLDNACNLISGRQVNRSGDESLSDGKAITIDYQGNIYVADTQTRRHLAQAMEAMTPFSEIYQWSLPDISQHSIRDDRVG